MQTVLFYKGKPYIKKEFSKEKELEQLVFHHSTTLFGASSILIDAKRRLNNKYFGMTIPDGFLFDLKYIHSPQFYLIEVELAKHSFDNHILPQITWKIQ